MHFKLYSNLMRSNSQISVNRDYSDCQTCSHNHHAPHLLHKKATGIWCMPTYKMPPNMQIIVPMCSDFRMLQNLSTVKSRLHKDFY